MAGRVCLVNSVLTALPLYYISFFRVPRSVSREITSIQRKFLWGCSDGQRKISWISWDKVTLPKAQGGLGVKNVTLFNTAMLAKWRWTLFHLPSSIWSQVLLSKYGGGSNLWAQNPSNKESIWWSDLLIVCGGDEEGNWFDKMIEWRVGGGSRVRFWLDKRAGTKRLAIAYPRLFINSTHQHSSIVEGINFHRAVQDSWRWLGDSSGEFSVRSA
uniref:Ribonuclease H protein At1g65750 family n=1 Tax=Cajanus cajan TaxID=3821 RepID=A0A151QMF0_CAJCA|nr:Putative ribonuclease H protein At1g65750 family [Cajanus cajan]